MSGKIADADLENMGPEEIIHQILVMSHDAAQEAQPDENHRPGFRSPYKDGWLPDVHGAYSTPKSTHRDKTTNI